METTESSRELAWIRSLLDRPLPVTPEAAVIATNLQGLVAYWNEGAERLYGWSETEALGRDILDLTPAKYTRDQSAAIMTALQAGEVWSGEILLRRRDGTPILAFVLDIPVGDFANDQGAIVGVSVQADQGPTIEGDAAGIAQALRHRFVERCGPRG